MRRRAKHFPTIGSLHTEDTVYMIVDLRHPTLIATARAQLQTLYLLAAQDCERRSFVRWSTIVPATYHGQGNS